METQPVPSSLGHPHFIQQGDGPVFIGPGIGTLACSCGNTLIQGYDPARFLAVGLQCGRCGTLTMTPSLPDGAPPPFAAIVAENTTEERAGTTTLPGHVYVIGRAEMDRITALWQPVDPPDSLYQMSPALLDEAEALYLRHVGAKLPSPSANPDQAFAGVREHALGWAVGHLRQRLAQAAWSVSDSHAISAAAVQVCGFLHFAATWSHHPLFPAMVTTAGQGGFPLHGLAPFAAAHVLSRMGNRIGFLAPDSTSGRLGGFVLATGPTEQVSVRTVAFDRFEHPLGERWSQAALRSAVIECIAAEQGRINLRHPGLLLLSPGIALGGFDEALIEAVKAVLPTAGRRNRGLIAVAPVVLRMQALPDPHALRFGYGLFPVPNRHYQGEGALQEPGANATAFASGATG